MKSIQWEPEFSVLIEAMDMQHQGLIDLLNRTIEAVDRQHSPSNACEIISQLLEYTRVHFRDEETLMKEYEFPEVESHSRMHARLTARVVSFERMIQDGEQISSDLIRDFLLNWLKTHIIEMDKQYGFYIQSQLEQDSNMPFTSRSTAIG